MGSLDGRVAIVTGGGRGIGRAVAKALAREGVRVTVTGRSKEALEAVAHEIGGQAIVCDVTREEDVTRLTVIPADILVANAGVTHATPLHKETLAGWNEVIATNLTGTFLPIRAVLPGMLARKRGRIVCVASVAAKVGFKYTGAYVASKHGVLGLVRSLALEVADRGITVNCVCPGWTETDMVRDAVANISQKTGRSAADAERALAQMSPQNRIMSAEEIAEVTLFLCRDEAAGVTGQAWNVDGGEVMS